MEKEKLKGHLVLFVAYVIFGLNTPISKTLMPDVLSPYTLTIFRMTGAAILFWGVSFILHKEHVPLKDIGLLALASLFSIVANQMPFIVGLSYSSPIDASIIVTLLPIFSMVFAAIFIKEPITLLKVLGVVIGASGAISLILGHYSEGLELRNSDLIGIGFLFLSVISFSLYLTLFKSLIQRYKPVTLMKWMFLFATIFCLPFCAKDLMATDYASFNSDVYMRIGFVVIFATFISYFLIPIGQKVLRPTIVSMYNYLQPIVTTFLTVLMGMDTFGWDKTFAVFLVFSGVYIVSKSKSKAQVDAEKAKKPVFPSRLF
jgi:drug/metabolite transporter (DMT)-like permease